MTFVTVCTLLVLIRNCQGIFPPLLNVSKSYVDVPPNTSLTVECKGEEKVSWHYKTVESWKSEKSVSTSEATYEDTKRNTIYIALLHLPPSYVFTGLYTCSYNNVINMGFQRNASVYVFMNDPHHLFVPQTVFNTTLYLSLNARNHLYVPCLPTNSKLNVTLWYYIYDSSEPQHMSTNDLIKFDPTKGFLIREPISRNLTCRGYWNNFQESTPMFKIQVSNDSMLKPFIEGSSFYWKVGDNNYLNCSVAVTSSGNIKEKFLKWSYPHANDSDTKVTEGYPQLESRDNYYFLYRTLNVTTVETSHEGFYTCSLIDSDRNGTIEVNKAQVYVSVNAEQPVESVRLVRENDIPSPVIAMPGKSVTFSANVTNYYLEEIEILWEKNGLLIQDSPKYKLYSHSLPLTLSINNLEISDAGKYCLTLRRVYQYTARSICFLLAIESIPSVQILQPFNDRFYEVNNMYQLQCQAESYPRSNITWMWKNCSNWDLCNSSNERLVITNVTSISGDRLENSMFLVTSVMNVTAFGSGIYYCEAINGIGKNETSIPFIVTDILRGLPVFLNTEDQTPSGNSEVKIECQITSMIYKNITWSFIQIPGNYNMVDINDLSGFKILSELQDFTELSVLSFKARKNRSGLYACTYFDKQNNVFRDKFIGVFVTSEATPPPSSIPSGSGNLGGNPLLTSTTVIVISVVVVAALLIIITIVVVAVKIKLKQRKNLRYDPFAFQAGQLDLINPNLPLEDQVELLPYDPRWEFPKDRLKLGRVIGHGAFGRVVKAEAIGMENNVPYTTVAVKMLKDKNDDTQYKSLMAELKIMIHLGRHVNILNLMGAVTKNLYKGELMVMVEYCCHGNLRSYLLKHREKFINQIDPETGKVNPDITYKSITECAEETKQKLDYNKPIGLGISNPSYNYSSSASQLIKTVNSSSIESSWEPTSSGSNRVSGDTSTGTVAGSESGYSSTGEVINFYSSGKEAARYSGILTTTDLLCYCFQCAQGMSYLASRKLLHRDLAARNILLAEGNVIKISDFGLSKDVYKYSKYVKKADGPLPVKWMAIESIRDRVFTIKSDVWSFGVLMWEIFTLGGNPYPGFDMNEGFFRRLREGYRLEKPEYSPADVYQIMLNCWNEHPKDRPDFSFLGEQLGEMLEATVKEYYLDLNGPYATQNSDLRNLEDYLNMNRSNYQEMTANSQETNVGNTPDYVIITDSDSAPKKSPYYNIPPIIEDQVANEYTPDFNNDNTRIDLSVQVDSTKSEAKDEEKLGKENLSVHNSSTKTESETEENRMEKL